MEMPNLLDVQLRAFQTLLQTEAAIQEREDVGLERVFNEIFPISDVNGNFSLEFVRYALGEPKYDMEECMERDMTYAAPLKATLRLIVWENGGEERRPKDIIEKEVYLGDLPLLTPLGTFIVNGAERVIVSQLHRSPGVVFEENLHPNGSKLFSARIIPFRGSWVEFTIDIHDVVAVHIDKKKKFPATALLRAVGRRRGHFTRDERGVTAVEFALLAVPFFAIVGAILETAMIFLASAVLDAAVHDASRLILTGQAQTSEFDIEDFRQKICDHAFGFFGNCSAIHLRVTPVTNFASASSAPPLDRTCTESCDWTVPQVFTPGKGSSVVMVQAFYKWPTILNFADFTFADLGDNSRLLGAARVFRNEPF
jgi:Flp pilus assembly protein TadG